MSISHTATSDWVDVNVRIEAFEVARRSDPRARIEAYLPSGSDEQRIAVLTELIRVDMEYAWQEDASRAQGVSDYLQRFPELNDYPAYLEQIAWEENRQRQFVRRAVTSSSASATGEVVGRGRSPLSLVAPVALADGEVAGTSPTDATGELPALGTEFLGFRLLAILGEGAFSRVYLARQGDLANRLVALKVARDVFDEPETLASLQHTNIVPIFSVHRLGSLEAICMPYLGSTTLADLVESLESSPVLPTGADALLGTMYGTFRSHPQDQPTVARSLRVQGSTQVTSITRTEPIPESHFDAAVPSGAAKQKPTTAIDELRQRTYVDAVVWLAAKLAGGLAHAHERGVLHQDLKPANVLFTEEGEPMLLDFNLASNSRTRRSECHRVGGTLPYMSPEHLKAFQARQALVDPRTDIFSLGVILYQLLSGRQPFPTRPFRHASDIEQMIEDRMESPEDLRRINRMVTPAVAAIVARCLASDPDARYRSARDLHEDLLCQYSHRTLVHLREPSIRERIVKWAKRHPKISSGTSVGIMAVLVLTLVAAGTVERNRRILAMEVRHRFESHLVDFERQANEVRYLLHAPTPSSDQLRSAIELSEQNVARFLDVDRGHRVRSSYESLLEPPVRAALGEQLYLLVRAHMLLWKQQRAHGEGSAPDLSGWLKWNDQALALYAPSPPQALRWQRAQILEWLGETKSAAGILQEIELEGMGSAQDLFLTATELMGSGKLRQALLLLQRLLAQAPDHFWGRLALGHCWAGLGRDREAMASYDIALALRPAAPWPYFLRGISELRLQQDEAAARDLAQAIAYSSQWPEALLMHAVAAQRLHHWVDAINDLKAALDAGASPMRVHCMLARVYHDAGHEEKAQEELRLGLGLPSTDEMSWVTRGLAVLPTDPEESLRCFDEALSLNGNCRPALQNKAYVLSEVLGKHGEAAAVLERMQQAYPDYLPAAAGRAFLLAKLGRRDDAVGLADDCLLKSPEPGVIYQLAGVFAQTARHVPADADRAVGLLAVAIRYGVDDHLLENDPGLDPVRQHPKFRELVAMYLPTDSAAITEKGVGVQTRILSEQEYP